MLTSRADTIRPLLWNFLSVQRYRAAHYHSKRVGVRRCCPPASRQDLSLALEFAQSAARCRAARTSTADSGEHGLSIHMRHDPSLALIFFTECSDVMQRITTAGASALTGLSIREPTQPYPCSGNLLRVQRRRAARNSTAGFGRSTGFPSARRHEPSLALEISQSAATPCSASPQQARWRSPGLPSASRPILPLLGKFPQSAGTPCSAPLQQALWRSTGFHPRAGTIRPLLLKFPQIAAAPCSAPSQQARWRSSCLPYASRHGPSRALEIFTKCSDAMQRTTTAGALARTCFPLGSSATHSHQGDQVLKLSLGNFITLNGDA